MRALSALLVLGACWRSSPPSSSPAAPPPPAAPVSAPHTFPPSTDALAVLYPARALIDEVHGRVFVHRNSGVDVLALATGAPAGHVDLGWSGEMWAAATMLEAFHTPDAHVIEVTLVDPAAATRIATCQRTVKAPAGSLISRIDAFTYKGQPYLKWETAPPPEMHGGAAMTEAQIDAWAQRFQAAYTCGLVAVHVKGTACTLDPISYRAADLESCETRSYPGQRVLPSTIIGDITYSIDEDSGTGYPGPHLETSTFVVRDKASGAERWRTVVDQRQYAPPPP